MSSKAAVKLKDPSANSLAKALWAPDSIALVGASEDEQKHTARPLQYLLRHGFAGRIHPVNPKRPTVQGIPAYPSVGAIEAAPDHAMVMVPAAAVPEVLRDCGRAGVSCATVYSDGFAEAGPEGRRRQEELVAIARDSGLRLLGPNSIGLVNAAKGVALSANEVLSLPFVPGGRIALVSQSGSMLGALLSRGQARGIGFSKLVSVGNEADLDVAELCELLLDDPESDAILLFLETVRRPQAFAAMARRAQERGKPLIAFRLGQSQVVEELAASHTGALLGSGRALEAFLRDLGVVLVTNFEALLEIPPLVVGRAPSTGRRVTAMTTTGGGGALVIDKLGADRVQLVPPPAALRQRLAARGIAVADSPLIDLTLAGTNARTYGAVLDELMASDHCDLVLAIVGSSSQFRPDRAVAPIREAAARAGKPLAVYLAPQAEESLGLLLENGIAAFRTPEACADAIEAFLSWRPCRAAPEETAESERWRRRLAGIGKGRPPAAQALLDLLGLGQPREYLWHPDAPLPAALPAGIDFPVVAKVVSADVPHKTEVGGVRLGIGSVAELQEACSGIVEAVRAAAPGAAIEAIAIQAQERGLVEAIVGYRLDPVVGPTITLGAGGVLAEIYRDIAVRPAPVSRAVAQEMIAEVRALQTVGGYRNLPRGDLEALADAVVALSHLALIAEPRILDAEVNPLLVRAAGQGVVALDALLRVEATP